jgi:hypothetical protein
MTLKDAILAVMDEYDNEVRGLDSNTDTAVKARDIYLAEIAAIDSSTVIEAITEGRSIQPPKPQRLVRQWLIRSIRLGMRIQRKLDRPDEPTTMFDRSYDDEPGPAPTTQEHT